MARTAAPKRASKAKVKPKKKNSAAAIDAADYDLGFDDEPQETTRAARKSPGPFYKAGLTHAPEREAPGRKPPPEHSRWKPGQSGNPLGGKLHDPALKAIKNLTKKELADIGNLVVKGEVSALRALAADEGETVLKRMVASVCFRVIDFGDMGALDTLLNRLVGKVKDEVAHSGDAPRIIVTLPSNGREAKV